MTAVRRLDVAPEDLPEALRALHVATPVGRLVTVEVPLLDAQRLDDVVTGAGFAFAFAGSRRAAAVGRRGVRATAPERSAVTAPESSAVTAAGGGWAPVPSAGGARVRLERLRSLPDTVGPALRLLVVGLNPSEVAADAGFGFAGPTNRFWPAALASGMVSEARDPGRALRVDRVGMTDLVKRATPRSSLVTAEEYRAGADRIDRLAAWLRPSAVCFVGLEGWRAARDRKARPGWQPAGAGGRPAYVMPSTSGLNASARLADLVEHLRTALAGPPPV